MKPFPALFVLLSCLSLTPQAQAQHSDGHYTTDNAYTREVTGNAFIAEKPARPWLLAREQTYISKAQAIDIAQQRTNGKVLSAELIQKKQHAFYKIKVLTDSGRIKTLHINAQANNR